MNSAELHNNNTQFEDRATATCTHLNNNKPAVTGSVRLHPSNNIYNVALLIDLLTKCKQRGYWPGAASAINT